MEEENENGKPEALQAQPEAQNAAGAESDLGKFKSVNALYKAYRELEAEFTRRSQKLKALEEQAETAGEGAGRQNAALPDEALYAAVAGNEGVRARVLNDYFSSLRGVPLMAGGGAGVTAPVQKPKTVREAGELALGYLRKK